MSITEIRGYLDFMIDFSQHSPKKFDKVKENERYLALFGLWDTTHHHYCLLRKLAFKRPEILHFVKSSATQGTRSIRIHCEARILQQQASHSQTVE